MGMSISRRCTFHREYGNSKESGLRGYCDLDHDWTVCRGDIHSCKKIDLLRKYLLEEKRREGGARW
jgi:hypothetical protein